MKMFIGMVAIIATLMLTASVFALPTPIPNPPTGAINSPILSLSYQVKNDEDSGNVGYWALDGYTKTVTVWNTAVAGKYAVYATYTGTFCTFKNALSPMTGAVEPNDGCGTETGAYDATFTSVSGKIAGTTAASYDFSGTQADILKGTYGNGQTGATTKYNPILAYFPDYLNFVQPAWSWTYTFANGQTWVNDINGNAGDIITNSGEPLYATAIVPPATCGISVSGGPLSWTIVQGQTSNQESVNVANSGTVATTSFTVSGTIWAGTLGNTMPVGQTSVYDTAWYPLPSTPGTLFGNVIPASGSVSPLFTVTIPANQPGDTYTQTITFNAGC